MSNPGICIFTLALVAGCGPHPGSNGHGMTRPPPPDPCIQTGMCKPGVWTNVTPATLDLTAPLGCGDYGSLSVQVNAAQPNVAYTHFDCRGIWRSTDYGLTWSGPINSGAAAMTTADCAGGIAVPPNSASSTIYMSCIRGSGTGFWRSSNGGVDFTRYMVAPGGARQDFYPPVIDPYDENHLLMAGHESSQYVQSSDGGQSWSLINIDPRMVVDGGTSAFVFIDTGDPATTRDTWLYLAQATGGTVGTWRTSDGGATWKQVDKNEKEHSYYQIYQPDTKGVVFMAGVYSDLGWGVLRSSDYGQTWAHVGLTQNENIVFGTARHIYALDAYAEIAEIADAPGTGTWQTAMPPPVTAPAITGQEETGTVQAVVTSDGTYNIILTANWNNGVWRYIEPLQ
jgi:hypothetical protein